MTGRPDSARFGCMKPSTIFACALAALILTVSPASAGTDLAKEMKVLKKVTKDLGRLEGDFAKGQKLAKEAIEAVNKSKDLVPEVVGKITDEKAKAAAIEDYKKQMTALAEGYAAVEKACAEKDEAKLKEALDGLDAMKKKGHEKFTEEE